MDERDYPQSDSHLGRTLAQGWNAVKKDFPSQARDNNPAVGAFSNALTQADAEIQRLRMRLDDAQNEIIFLQSQLQIIEKESAEYARKYEGKVPPSLAALGKMDDRASAERAYRHGG